MDIKIKIEQLLKELTNGTGNPADLDRTKISTEQLAVCPCSRCKEEVRQRIIKDADIPEPRAFLKELIDIIQDVRDGDISSEDAHEEIDELSEKIKAATEKVNALNEKKKKETDISDFLKNARKDAQEMSGDEMKAIIDEGLQKLLNELL